MAVSSYLLYIFYIYYVFHSPPPVSVFKTDTETFLTIDTEGEVLISELLSTTANIFDWECRKTINRFKKGNLFY